MASNDPVVQIKGEMPPRASMASLFAAAGGSTPAENRMYWRFPDAATSYMDYKCALRGYGGNGLTFTFWHDTSSGTVGNNVRYSAAIRRIADDAEDLDTSQTYDFNAATWTTPSARGELAVDTISFTSGADMDNLVEGEEFILRIRREPGDAADNLAGDSLLWDVEGRET